jgi:hypothetical protein
MQVYCKGARKCDVPIMDHVRFSAHGQDGRQAHFIA